jgi:hypothetical protein
MQLPQAIAPRPSETLIVTGSPLYILTEMERLLIGEEPAH